VDVGDERDPLGGLRHKRHRASRTRMRAVPPRCASVRSCCRPVPGRQMSPRPCSP
jgi:hypothetical protein